jgi:hypothetical protein
MRQLVGCYSVESDLPALRKLPRLVEVAFDDSSGCQLKGMDMWQQRVKAQTVLLLPWLGP